MQNSSTHKRTPKAFVSTSDLNFEQFTHICSQKTKQEDYPSAKEILYKIPVYEGKKLREDFCIDAPCSDIKNELHRCLNQGPGVFFIKGFFPDTAIVDESTKIFKQIIQKEKNSNFQGGDHFAKTGANERIWNSFQKVAEESPKAFINYYKNPLYALVSEAWLGPAYQITAQVNIVKPGGQAQSPHRDYHLGFQSKSRVLAYPRAVQVASQFLTLQGAIVHSDMPVSSGPTLLLPFSQQYDLGYLAYSEEAFASFFSENAIQMPLEKGDAMFFSPALFHGAGNNQTKEDRIANLIQVSSAFGKTMESIDRYALMHLIYPTLTKTVKKGEILDDELLSLIAATADAYSFPTNLDTMPPLNGNAPETTQELLMRALAGDLPQQQFKSELDKHHTKRRA